LTLETARLYNRGREVRKSSKRSKAMATRDETMAEVNRRVAEAVERLVAQGVPRREAFARHLKALASEWPQVFTAYVAWLAEPRAA
jgi:hypothetical protein